ncbi:NAD(P)-dependent oxidoreductase [Ruania suaedae]|uniref:NAD(P)-dependent oxidoreductase n=1 Tax=Ruania suaedae TaxID=2897774 RepID=UPI001E56FD87|nr:NAD(P)-dependent oxidoreductase [Ruania suaedae]UFU01898.1 NAD(P)-dependent oxidoreductase [Ruania suaedae]
MRIGFIGLGVMGVPMALNLINAGHSLTVHRVKERSQVLIDSGATAAGSAADVARAAEVVILMLPDTPDVEHVLTADDGVLAGLAPGALVIDMSSISPVATRSLAEQVEAAGGAWVDAPVSGGEVGARDGALTIFIGGAQEPVERAMPLLEVMGKTITHLGPAGAGQATKVVNQIIVGLTIEAVAEGLAVAEASGIDPAAVREALSGGFASSRILEMHGKRMVERTFDPGFRMRLHRKDLGLALAAAKHHGTSVPGVEAVAAQMDAAIARDWAELDHSALFRLLTEEPTS